MPIVDETAAFLHITYIFNRLVRGSLRFDEKTPEDAVTGFARLAGNEQLSSISSSMERLGLEYTGNLDLGTRIKGPNGHQNETLPFYRSQRPFS